MAHLEHAVGSAEGAGYTDVFVLHLDDSDELSAAYVSQMEQIVDKVLGSREIAIPRDPRSPAG